jgi:hypothetical protein
MAGVSPMASRSGGLVIAGDLNVCLDRGDHYTGKTSLESAGRKPFEILTPGPRLRNTACMMFSWS